MMIIRLGPDQDLGGKKNSSKASAYSLRVFLGDIDLIAAIPLTIQSAEEGAFSVHCKTAQLENWEQNMLT